MSHILSALWRSTRTRNLLLKESIISGQNYTQISKKLHTIGQPHKKKALTFVFPNFKPPILEPYPSVSISNSNLKLFPLFDHHILDTLGVCVLYVSNIDTGKIGVFVLPF